LCLPDFMLGILNKYLSIEDKNVKSNEYHYTEAFFDMIKVKLKTICVFTKENKIRRFKLKNGFIDNEVHFCDLLKKKT